jgi:hypothetical protein
MGCRLLVIALLLSLFTTSCKPCDRLINGLCYDEPNSSNPGLTARWEMIDLETGKPIPDVWISFYWRKFKDENSRGECARNVIGRTDAKGQFSNTAKDGSWLMDNVLIYKPGYYPVRYPLSWDQTHITDFHALIGAPLGTYRGWEQRLKTMGYRVDPERNATYRKDFELGKEYQRIFDDVWSSQGQRRYWLKHRGFPSNYQSLYVGQKCLLPNRGGEAKIESVGYDDPKNESDYVWKWRGWDAYQLFCDDSWDAVTTQPIRSYDVSFAYDALLLRGSPFDNAARHALYESYFDPKTLLPNSPERITPEQRHKFCTDLKPYTKIGAEP